MSAVSSSTAVAETVLLHSTTSTTLTTAAVTLPSSKKQPVGPMTRADVLQRSDPETLCLIIVDDKVYDCTQWQHRHPGGYLTIRALCGKDATDAFTYSHPKFVKDRMLASFFYADLIQTTKGQPNNKSKADKYNDEATVAFRELTEKMEEAGMFETDLTFYYKKAAVYSCMFLLVLAGVLCSDKLWIHALSGALLGLFWQQMAFVGHDLGHNSMTHNLQVDSFWGIIVGNLMTGVSMAWWKRSHNVHHVVTNSCDYDPDIQHLPVMAVDPTFFSQPLFSTYTNRYLQVDELSHFLVKYQHWLYYPVMAVARVNLYIQSINHALCLSYYAATKDLVWRRELQIATLIGFWTWLIALTLQLPSWQSRVLFLVPAHVVAGILHVQITLSHFAMPVHTGVTYDDASNGYLRTQLRGSMDIDCPKYMDWFHGGIQFQVVHHIWPRLPRRNLRTAKGMLMAFCEGHGLEYHQASFLQANAMVIGKLKETSKSTKRFSEFFTEAMNLNG
eukprot:CAMPEP_0178744054 /NCGR_PEP_ID=MMETSP0744-20121128/6540_1 /TAXON_ID=913974 /ORGANISM="Nitzschia punctata, Strain CCMP561" /LENGTH=501 /DNA_ID=CAMNT_0020397111 /DNA_START=325 /DNA_END=1830 /DNA_ORIENTATION=+